MRTPAAVLLPLVAALLAAPTSFCFATRVSPLDIEKSVVFPPSLGGYPCFRIPSAVTTDIGTVLAFAEGRRGGCGDFAGPHDIVLRRSTDSGRTWGGLIVVAAVASPPFESGDALWNPGVVVDSSANGGSGRVHMLFNRAPAALNNPTALENDPYARETFSTYSDDDGLSWAAPTNITSQAQERVWVYNAVSPGRGIQLSASGDLVVPGYHGMLGNHNRNGPNSTYHAHVLISSDRGGTWRRGGTVTSGTNECQIVEASADGPTLLINARSYEACTDGVAHCRQAAVSKDGGVTFAPAEPVPALPEPVCQASMVAYPEGIAFSNPASTTGRKNMTLRTSPDGGATWPWSRVVDPFGSGYSAIFVPPQPSSAQTSILGVLYESWGTGSGGLMNITAALVPL